MHIAFTGGNSVGKVASDKHKPSSIALVWVLSNGNGADIRRYRTH
jgi:hypothetical protein